MTVVYFFAFIGVFTVFSLAALWLMCALMRRY